VDVDEVHRHPCPHSLQMYQRTHPCSLLQRQFGTPFLGAYRCNSTNDGGQPDHSIRFVLCTNNEDTPWQRPLFWPPSQQCSNGDAQADPAFRKSMQSASTSGSDDGGHDPRMPFPHPLETYLATISNHPPCAALSPSRHFRADLPAIVVSKQQFDDVKFDEVQLGACGPNGLARVALPHFGGFGMGDLWSPR